MAKKKKSKLGKTSGSAFANMPKPSDESLVEAAAWSIDVAADTNTRKRKQREAEHEAQTKQREAQQLVGPAARKRAKHGLKPGASLSEMAIINKKVKNVPLKPKPKAKAKAAVDLWEEEPACPGVAANDWLGSGFRIPGSVATTNKAPGKYTRRGSSKPERSRAPAVEVAPAGASVRPREEDRQRLLNLAADHELEKQETRAVVQAARKKHQAQPEGNQRSLMGGGTDAGDDDEELEFFEFSEPAARAARTDDKKLTRAQRNKRDRHKLRTKEALEAKAGKAKEGQLKQATSLVKEIKSEDKQIVAHNVEKKEHREEMLKCKPRKLSRNQFEQSRPEVQLSDELATGLRGMGAPEGSLLRDRYQSLQKRNILEPGAKQRAGHGKHKLKVKTRHTINDNGTCLNGLKEQGQWGQMGKAIQY